MDFFSSQDKARSKTNILIFYFCLAIVTMIIVIYVVIAAIMRPLFAMQAWWDRLVMRGKSNTATSTTTNNTEGSAKTTKIN